MLCGDKIRVRGTAGYWRTLMAEFVAVLTEADWTESASVIRLYRDCI